MMTEAPAVADVRRPPFCYQTHAALDAIRAHWRNTEVEVTGPCSTAIAIYVGLTEAANRLGGQEARDGFEADRALIAEFAGVSRDTLDRYVPALAQAGVLVVERRRQGRVNLPNVWKLVEPEITSAVSAPPSPDSAARGGPDSAAVNLVPEETTLEETPPTPPAAVLIDVGLPSKQNLPLNVLCEVCGIQPGSPRVKEAVAALNRNNRARDPAAKNGIRDLCWHELVLLVEVGGAPPDTLERLRENPERFEEGLARRIQTKAALYRAAMPGAMLTPTALRKYWLDLEVIGNDGGLTAAQMAAQA